MHPIVPHLRTLNMYNRPDYLMYYNCFLKLMKNHKVKTTDKYDWETDEQSNIRRSVKSAVWENAQEFFASDPLGINDAPLPGNSTKSNTVEDMENLLKK